MNCEKSCAAWKREYRLILQRCRDDVVIDTHEFSANSSGLGALIRAIDLGTNDAVVSRVFGRRRKKKNGG